MTEKDLWFSIFQLIIDWETFSISDFSWIKNDDLETDKIWDEVVKVKKIYKDEYEERFISFYFEWGDRFPYSETVIDIDTKSEVINPRESNLIELDEQLFVLLDQQNQRLYISDQRQKNYFLAWLKAQTQRNLYLKALIEKSQFLEKLQSVWEISFCAEPNLLLNTNSLGTHLLEDIYGYWATEVRVSLSYWEGSHIWEDLMARINNLFSHQESFKKITVIWKTDDKLSSIFNMEEVVNKVYISAEFNKISKKYDPTQIFSRLIFKIKENEN